MKDEVRMGKREREKGNGGDGWMGWKQVELATGGWTWKHLGDSRHIEAQPMLVKEGWGEGPWIDSGVDKMAQAAQCEQDCIRTRLLSGNGDH